MPSVARTDVVLPMMGDYMQQVVRGEKNYEFRKYRIAPTVKRVWFYLSAPFSCIAYVCEIGAAVARNEGDPKLPEDGLGNKEFHLDWKGYDFVYRVRSVYKIIEPISLAKGIPNDVPWKSQKCIIPRADDETTETARRTRGKRAVTAGGDSDEEEEELRPRKKARAADSPSLNANL